MEENKQETSDIEVLGNTGVIEPVTEEPVAEPVQEATPVEPVVEEPAPAVEPAPEPTPEVAAAPAPEPTPEVAPAPTPVESAPVVTPEPAKPEEPKKKGKGGLLIVLLLLVVGLFAVWFFVLGGQEMLGLKSSEEPKQEEKKEEKKEESKKEEKKETKLTEAEVKEIYNRYHSKITNPNGYLGLFSVVEEYAYQEGGFKVSSLKNVTITYADYIYNQIKDKVKDKLKTHGEGETYTGYQYYNVKDVESYVKEEFKKLFGNNLEYDISLFDGCHTLNAPGDRERFELSPQCGGLATYSVKFEMTDYEEKDGVLKINENVTHVAYSESGEKTETESVYTWTYTKYENTYVLSEVNKKA